MPLNRTHMTVPGRRPRHLWRAAALLVMATLVRGAPEGALPPQERSQQEILHAAAGHLVNRPRDPRKAFPATRHVPEQSWFTLELRPVANWAYAFGPQSPKAWLNMGEGYDLYNLRPGRQWFYGVPFDIVDAETNRGRSCLALRSDKLRDSELPTELVVPVNRRAHRLYFLHGCGYAQWGQNREYAIVYADGTHAACLIRPAASAMGQGENIGDWFSDTLIDGEDVRPVPLLRDRDNRLVYLYILEWVNPRPDQLIKELRFRSDGSGAATVFLLAVSGFVK